MKSRKAFLSLLIVAVSLSAAGMSGFESILPNIYRLQDACNVYLLRSGHSGILIDAGADGLERELKSIGVEQIDWILHTHYHRDQCLGSAALKNAGTKIAIGKNEEDYLQPSAGDLPINLANRYLLSDELSDFGRRMEPFQKPGVDRVLAEGDEIIPSHWHHDHIGGIPVLAASEGAMIWVWEGLREHVEQPENFITTCWTSTRFKADRVLSEGETFEWGGYSFQVFHHPVHMEQQMGLAARVDGIKFYFMADGSGSNREGYMRSSIHCYNGISIRTGLIKTARSFDAADPYICVPAHSNAFATHPDTRQEFLAWAMAASDAITILLPPGHAETGFNPYWSSFYPANIRLHPGDAGEVALRIENTSGHRISGRAWIKSHGDIDIAQKEVNYDLGPGEDGEIPVGIKIKSNCRPGTYILTADIESGHELFGEYPQGYLVINE